MDAPYVARFRARLRSLSAQDRAWLRSMLERRPRTITTDATRDPGPNKGYQERVTLSTFDAAVARAWKRVLGPDGIASFARGYGWWVLAIVGKPRLTVLAQEGLWKEPPKAKKRGESEKPRL